MYDNDNMPLEPDPIADAALEHSSIQGSTPITKPNDPVYPIPVTGNPGISTREEFVKAAMQGIVAGSPEMFSKIPEMAVYLADATIAELNKENGE